MKLARDGIPTVSYLALAALLFAQISPVPAAVLVVAAGFAVWFYRDPDRTPPEGENVLVSPADGRVVEIEDADHPFTGPAVK
ncbi:MAG: phosphatidylserine decarboxylase, partial [Synergistaceae bacterium]|nr:phosphatidylserine decarboxylase [Synergistaceae bacterium]